MELVENEKLGDNVNIEFYCLNTTYSYKLMKKCNFLEYPRITGRDDFDILSNVYI